MHDAFEAVPVLQKLPASVQIESIAAYDDVLLAGLKDGPLLVYKINSKGGSKIDVVLTRNLKTFSRRPVVQLEAVPELEILLSLSDSVVSVHNLRTLAIIDVITKTKGATVFASDVQELTTTDGAKRHLLKLCVVNKRRLQTMFWKPNKNEFLEFKEDIVLHDIPKTVAWCEKSVCIGFKRDYFIVKLSTKELKELFTTGPGLPLMAKVGSGLGLSRGASTAFIDSEGLPTHKRAMHWSDHPSAMMDHHPYLLAVLPKFIEVRTVESKALVQSVELPRPRLICRASPRVMYIGSATDVYRLSELPIDMQVGQLLTNLEYEMALMLASCRENEVDSEMMNEIKLFYAFELFMQKKFEESLKIYTELSIGPDYVIGLYPNLLPTHYCSRLAYPNPVPTLEGSDLDKAMFPLIEYLTTKRNELVKVMSATKEPPSPSSSLDEASGLRKKSDRQLKQIIDTTLLKCYLKVREALVAPLLRLADNCCQVEESETALKKHGMFSELIILYETKGLHNKALDLLLHLQEAERDIGVELKGPDRTVEYLQKLGFSHLDLIFEYSRWVIKKYPQDALKIFTEDLAEVDGLPCLEVAAYLEKENRGLLLLYLEHLVFERQESDLTIQNVLASVHDLLVKVYLEAITELMALLPEGQQPSMQSLEPGDIGDLRSKLLEFLQTSKHCRPHRVIKLFPHDRFQEEKAILLGKQGFHDNALSIYIQQLHDLAKAEQYCKLHYDPTKEGAKDVYFYLMKHVINPLPTVLPMSSASEPSPGDVTSSLNDTVDGPSLLPHALGIIKRHADKIDTSKALDLLPESCTVVSVLAFLTDILNQKAQQGRRTHINKSLVHWDRLKIQEKAIFYQKRKFVVTEETTCDFCNRRILRSSFARYPDQKLVHLGCLQQMEALGEE